MAVLGYELADPGPPPSVDAIPGNLRRGRGSPRQVLVMSLVGTVVLALFGSRDLSPWAERLGGGPADQRALSLYRQMGSGYDGARTRLATRRLTLRLPPFSRIPMGQWPISETKLDPLL